MTWCVRWLRPVSWTMATSLNQYGRRRMGPEQVLNKGLKKNQKLPSCSARWTNLRCPCPCGWAVSPVAEYFRDGDGEGQGKGYPFLRWQYLPFHTGRFWSVCVAGSYAIGGGIPANTGNRNGIDAGAYHFNQERFNYFCTGGLRTCGWLDRSGPGNNICLTLMQQRYWVVRLLTLVSILRWIHWIQLQDPSCYCRRWTLQLRQQG